MGNRARHHRAEAGGVGADQADSGNGPPRAAAHRRGAGSVRPRPVRLRLAGPERRRTSDERHGTALAGIPARGGRRPAPHAPADDAGERRVVRTEFCGIRPAGPGRKLRVRNAPQGRQFVHRAGDQRSGAGFPGPICQEPLDDAGHHRPQTCRGVVAEERRAVPGCGGFGSFGDLHLPIQGGRGDRGVHQPHVHSLVRLHRGRDCHGRSLVASGVSRRSLPRAGLVRLDYLRPAGARNPVGAGNAGSARHVQGRLHQEYPLGRNCPGRHDLRLRA